jgi:hypothetical protein
VSIEKLLAASVAAITMALSACDKAPISKPARSAESKWLLVALADSGAKSTPTFNTFLDTSHVERLERNHIGAWMRTVDLHNRATFADHMVIDCNVRRFDVDQFISYDTSGVRTNVASLYESSPKPVPDDFRNWEQVDPIHPDFEGLVVEEACRRWSK